MATRAELPVAVAGTDDAAAVHVREVQAGYECGIGLENYQDLKGGDIIETYMVKETPRA